MGKIKLVYGEDRESYLTRGIGKYDESTEFSFCGFPSRIKYKHLCLQFSREVSESINFL